MNSIIPFKTEDQKNTLNKIHPVIRFIIPFLIVVPFLIIENLYLIITLLIFIFIFDLIFQLNVIKIFSKLKAVIPSVFLITIFIPFYIGETIIYNFNIGVKIIIYREGLNVALFIFLRVFGSIFVFMSFFSSFTYSEFINTLTILRLPSVFVGSLIIMLHYIPILASTNKKILEALEMRGKKVTSYWQKLKTHAFIMGKGIILNTEKSTQLFESLKMRGFSGKITFASKKVKLIDFLVLNMFLLLVILLIFVLNLELIYQEVFNLLLP